METIGRVCGFGADEGFLVQGRVLAFQSLGV